MSDAKHIAAALGGKKSGTGYIANCVGHDDTNPSMTIADGDKGVVVRCHAGCSQQELIAALRAKGLWATPKKNGTARLPW